MALLAVLCFSLEVEGRGKTRELLTFVKVLIICSFAKEPIDEARPSTTNKPDAEGNR